LKSVYILPGVFYFAVSVTLWNKQRNSFGGIKWFFEMTTGTNMASKAANATLQGQLAAVSLLLGWAGLSVHFQVYSIISHTDISIKPYLFVKCFRECLQQFIYQ